MSTRKLALVASLLVFSVQAHAASGYTGLTVFGDSLSDTGNNASVIDSILGGIRTPIPIPNAITGGSLVPTFPYASDRYTNANVWLDNFAPAIGQSATALRNGGSNYAFGGARVGPANPRGLLDPQNFPPTVATQVATFLASGPVDPGALYVLTGGGNDARDVFGPSGIAGLIAGNANTIAPALMPSISTLVANAAAQFASEVATNVAALRSAGAGTIVVWNVANVATTPESIARGRSFTSTAGAPSYAEIGNQLSDAMNNALATTVGNVAGVHIFDFHGILQKEVSNPTLGNVTDACATTLACDPSNYLYWDGIHPTSAMHAIVSTAMVDFVNAVPEPHSYAMMLVGVAMIGTIMAMRRPRPSSFT